MAGDGAMKREYYDNNSEHMDWKWVVDNPERVSYSMYDANEVIRELDKILLAIRKKKDNVSHDFRIGLLFAENLVEKKCIFWSN